VNALVVHKKTNEATDKHTDADPKADKHKGNLYYNIQPKYDDINRRLQNKYFVWEINRY